MDRWMELSLFVGNGVNEWAALLLCLNEGDNPYKMFREIFLTLCLCTRKHCLGTCWFLQTPVHVCFVVFSMTPMFWTGFPHNKNNINFSKPINVQRADICIGTACILLLPFPRKEMYKKAINIQIDEKIKNNNSTTTKWLSLPIFVFPMFWCYCYFCLVLSISLHSTWPWKLEGNKGSRGNFTDEQNDGVTKDC